MYNASRYFLCEPFSIIQTTKYFLLNKDNRFKAPITTCKLSLSPFIITITLEKLMYIFLYQDKKSDLMGLTNGQWIEENWAWNHFNRCIPSGNCSLSKNKKRRRKGIDIQIQCDIWWRRATANLCTMHWSIRSIRVYINEYVF